MTRSCLACGAAVAPGSRFCQACGRAQPVPAAGLLSPRFATPVAYTPRHLADRILNSRSALQGERKRVTVVFCDIVDSSTLAARLGGERMHGLLQRFFEVALDEIHRYEGTINQFLGDGFMALFGAPLALEQHERQATLAAVAIADRVKRDLSDAPELGGTRLALRMGINTGLVVVGKIGDNLRMDYTAVGDTTNVAAQLQAAADRGGILMSEGTWDRARDVVDSQPVGPVVLKGKAQPVVAHAVTAIRAGRSPAVTRRLTEFVGRGRELAELREALDHARHSRGQLVSIVGESGMGKSRLILEFRRTLGDDLLYLDGACLSYGSAIPYLPILGLLRSAFGIVDGDTPDRMVDKTARLVRDLGVDPDDTVPYLLHLLGVKQGTAGLDALSPEAIKSKTSEVLRQLVLRASHRRPLVLVVEDVHWIDQASEDFLSELVDILPAAAILFVATHRPGSRPLWLERSYASQIALRPLNDTDALALVRHIGGADIRAAQARTLVERGEGNPLFLEELVHAMRPRPGEDAGGIPQTLLGVLTARVDRLSDDAKELIQMAAVIGGPCSPSLLRQLVHQPDGVEARLRELVQLEFLHQITVGPEPEYAFKHVLTRDAVYQSLLERRRRTAHSAVAQALERQYAGRITEVVDVLAYHFDLGDDPERAVDYAIKAAERAQRRWANAQAVTFFERALARLASMPDSVQNRLRRIDAITKQAEVLFALGRHRDHVAVLESIRDIVESTGDPPRRATWYYWLGFLQGLTGARPEVAIAHCRAASELAEAAGLVTIGAYADTGLAGAYLIAGDLRLALAAGERALAVFERLGDTWWGHRALSQLSPAANYLADWERGLAYCRRMTELGGALDDLRLKVSGLVRTASTHVHRGDWQMALHLCDAALALNPMPYDSAAARAVRGYALVKAGRMPEGEEHLMEALAFYRRSHLRYTYTLFSLWLADTYIRQGAHEEARNVIEEVLRTAVELGYRFVEAVARRLLAEAVAGTDVARAAEELETSEKMLREREARNELGKVWVARACLNSASPDRALLEQAYTMFRELGTIDEPARVERLLGRTGS